MSTRVMTDGKRYFCWSVVGKLRYPPTFMTARRLHDVLSMQGKFLVLCGQFPLIHIQRSLFFTYYGKLGFLAKRLIVENSGWLQSIPREICHYKHLCHES